MERLLAASRTGGRLAPRRNRARHAALRRGRLQSAHLPSGGGRGACRHARQHHLRALPAPRCGQRRRHGARHEQLRAAPAAAGGAGSLRRRAHRGHRPPGRGRSSPPSSTTPTSPPRWPIAAWWRATAARAGACAMPASAPRPRRPPCWPRRAPTRRWRCSSAARIAACPTARWTAAHLLITIPTAPDNRSLNLAQAALLVAYELWLAAPRCPGSRRSSAAARRSAATARPCSPRWSGCWRARAAPGRAPGL